MAAEATIFRRASAAKTCMSGMSANKNVAKDQAEFEMLCGLNSPIFRTDSEEIALRRGRWAISSLANAHKVLDRSWAFKESSLAMDCSAIAASSCGSDKLSRAKAQAKLDSPCGTNSEFKEWRMV
eukprot:CAMPEP_0115144196 /NCGR_PEP_ID=MMETSP0227-20121206/61296_1 /TAXON_ID=89957 /ORGANISM="Polarella glacialis, Strain CCMP 1383" /LENGTH=124 /DNA_ID=CAMNT_0002553317 /DNA_START=270 /DNA_END=644 /DNA_ORIENTATION=-